MKLEYFKSKTGNFGDDLNAWLWPKIFKDLGQTDDEYFLGIGSLLSNESKLIKQFSDKKLVIFGSGVRPSIEYTNFRINNLWDVQFLRGPLSANSLNRQYEFIADAAYALRNTEDFKGILNTEKKYEVSLMPYFHSVDLIDWKRICKELGYHYISPFSEHGVEFTLKEIAASKKVITEAMHGAIVSDILRVPWHRFIFSTPQTEGERIADFKWNDWMYSIDIYNAEATYIPFLRKTFLHDWIKKASANTVSTNFYVKAKTREDLLAKLSKELPYYLSQDSMISKIEDRIDTKIADVTSKYFQ
jgi:hypothetical protein